jgi:hypothetical protein
VVGVVMCDAEAVDRCCGDGGVLAAAC